MRVALLLALLLALAGCGGEPETAPTTTAPATTTETARVAGTTLDGERISLDDFRGKPVFVNVWSSW